MGLRTVCDYTQPLRGPHILQALPSGAEAPGLPPHGRAIQRLVRQQFGERPWLPGAWHPQGSRP
jgi:hypothetical protein